MLFASPIALSLLIPWGIVSLWLLWGRGQSTRVPFLDLWQQTDASKARRGLRLPPIALAAMLAAMLLGVLASARPTAHSAAGGGGRRITVIVDRGLTFSAAGRRAEVIAQASEAIARTFGGGVTDLVLVPDGSIDPMTRSAWVERALGAAPAYVPTRDAVSLAVRQALARSDDAVVVLTDHAVAPDPRLIHIAPQTPLRNVGIMRFAGTTSPRAQTMVTVRNDSPERRATLRVRSGEQIVTQEIDLLPRGRETSHFLDLPSLGRFAIAEIDVSDDLPADNVAFIARERAWPKVEIRSPLPPEVQRVAGAYERSRPPAEAGERVAIVSSADPIPVDSAAAIVAVGPGDPIAAPMTVLAHPVVEGIDWQSVRAEAVAAPPGADWTAVLASGGRSLIAVRSTPARQVWVGLGSREFARTSEFVMLWTNIFDWLGGGAEVFTSSPPMVLGEEWGRVDPGMPADPGAPLGVFRRSDGVHRAISMSPVQAPPVLAPDWRTRLSALKRRPSDGIDLSWMLIVASLTCVLLAACAWPGRRLTPFSAPRTV